jgi:uncharacterized membrane protein required for colicin V production
MPTGAEGLINKISAEILSPLILLMMAVAVAYFLYGLFEMIRDGGNEEARRTGQQHMLWGVVGLFIMVAVYGIIHAVCRTIGVSC